jgi:aspartate/methionine/tyrosine aminotransferase
MWKELISEKNVPIEKNRISMPMVVSGLTNGIMNVADLFADPGDSVVCPDMFWGNYRLIFEARKQAIIETFPFFTKNGGLNIEGCRETIEEKAKNGKVILLLNFPNNPTGYSPTTREAQQLSKAIHACAEEGITVLAVIDDAYFGLFYDENTYKNSLFADLHDLHENVLAVKVDGATKEDYVWGFRIGFVTFGCRGMSEDQYSALETKLKGALRSSVSNSSRPAQSILKQAIKNETYRREKQNIFNMLQARYHKVREILEKRTTGKALKPLPFNSGYFMSFRFEGGSAEALRKELLLKEGIGTISIQDTYLRVAYSSVDLEHIEELFETIFATADQLSS